MATLFVGAIGAAVGSAFGPGGAWKGFQIGTAVGSIIDANENRAGTSGLLSDLRASGSQYGAAIPRVWGKGKAPGNVIWVKTDVAGNTLVEHTVSSGGKKGGTSSASYTATFAVAFAEGSILCPDGGFVTRTILPKRLWADDKVVYDWTDSTNQKLTLAWYPGSESQTQDATMVAALGASATPAYRGLAYAVINDMPLGDFGNRIPNLVLEYDTDAVTVGSLIGDLCRMAGLTTGELDLGAGTSAITGYVLAGRGPLDGAVEEILQAKGADLAEIDGVLRLVARGGDAVLTIAESDLGFFTRQGTETPQAPKIERSLVDGAALPQAVTVEYVDQDRSFDQSSQTFELHEAATNQITTLRSGLAMSATEALRLAATLAQTAWLEAESQERLTLPLGYLVLAPADPILVSCEGALLRRRIVRMRLSGESHIELEVVADDPAVLTQTAVADTGAVTIATSPPPTGKVSPSTFRLYSGIELSDADATSPGFYVWANGDSAWRGGDVYLSLDGTTYQLVGHVGRRGTFGTADGALASASGLDTTNQPTVTLAMGGPLANCAEKELYNGVNRAYMGAELLGFEHASLVSGADWRLSTLLRGQRSSPTSGHSAGEIFALCDGAQIRIPVDPSSIGEVVDVKVLSTGEALVDVTAQSITIAAPHSPYQTNNAPVAPTSVAAVATAYNASGAESLTFEARFAAAPQAVQTYDWESSTDAGATWSGITNTGTRFTAPAFSSGSMMARCRAVSGMGAVSGWTQSANQAFVAPPNATATAPDSVLVAISYVNATEVLTFRAIYTASVPSPGQTYQSQVSYDGGATWLGPDGTSGSTWNGATVAQTITSGTIRMRFRAVAEVGGAVSAWVQSAGQTYAPPPIGVISNLAIREAPSGAIDGSNKTFVLLHTPATATERLALNGVLLQPGASNDYTISAATITMAAAPVAGDDLLCDYYY
ncbi:MAG: hypothetical protein HYR64_03785 [Fimbriimonas ginsengisoli]|uniref:Tip attachment protein J domain-containing protein n=1 Tax=Fimbriimonas ginsengisoli TaxID=1005039 RepID=A0A931PVF3_FIMGI|nr:hypothetical protein [Fimbriimonas ginsengisoli]